VDGVIRIGGILPPSKKQKTHGGRMPPIRICGRFLRPPSKETSTPQICFV
jgi:hypothetical protein